MYKIHIDTAVKKIDFRIEFCSNQYSNFTNSFALQIFATSILQHSILICIPTIIENENDLCRFFKNNIFNVIRLYARAIRIFLLDL